MSNYIKGPALQKYSPGIAELSIGHAVHSVSWKTHAEGFATLKAQRNVAAGWVSIVATETPTDGRARQVMLTLTKEEAAALCEFLTGDAKRFPIAKDIF